MPKKYNELPSGYSQIFTGQCQPGDIIKSSYEIQYADAYGLLYSNIEAVNGFKFYRKVKHPLLTEG